MSVKEPEQIIPQLLPIEKNGEAQKNTILTNIIKMLTERRLLLPERQATHIQRITAIQSDDQSYRIDFDSAGGAESRYGPDNKFMMVKLINQKITSISKSSGISDFLTAYKMIPKIIVVTAINPKAQYLLQSDTSTYPNTEVFLERELLINLIDHVSQPKFIVLSEEEIKAVLEKYHARRREIPKILISDPVSRYYNVKTGQMFRIIRPSETSGEAVTYRLVVRGQIRDN